MVYNKLNNKNIYLLELFILAITIFTTLINALNCCLYQWSEKDIKSAIHAWKQVNTILKKNSHPV